MIRRQSVTFLVLCLEVGLCLLSPLIIIFVTTDVQEYFSLQRKIKHVGYFLICWTGWDVHIFVPDTLSWHLPCVFGSQEKVVSSPLLSKSLVCSADSGRETTRTRRHLGWRMFGSRAFCHLPPNPGSKMERQSLWHRGLTASKCGDAGLILSPLHVLGVWMINMINDSH